MGISSCGSNIIITMGISSCGSIIITMGISSCGSILSFCVWILTYYTIPTCRAYCYCVPYDITSKYAKRVP